MGSSRKTAAALAVTAMAALMPINVYAAEKIEEITLEIESAIYAGQSSSDVEATVDTDGCYVDSVSVTNEPDEWEEDDKPKLRIVVNADDDYTFASGLKKDDVYLDDEVGTVTSLSRGSSKKVTISVTLNEIFFSDDYDSDLYDLDVYELAWDDAMDGIAYWTGCDYAKRYEVRLFRNGSGVTQVFSTEKTSYDFSRYFTEEGDYIFKVRAVRSTNNTGSWRESEELYVTGEQAAEIRRNGGQATGSSQGGGYTGTADGQTPGAWLLDHIGYWWCNPDKTYPVSAWKYINGAWYYFNDSGYCVMNQWVITNDLWYYCGSSGAMLVNAATPDGYYVGGDGVWIR